VNLSIDSIRPLIVQVAVPSPLYRVFDYQARPEMTIDSLPVGGRVRVSFGRSSVVGLILGVSTESDYDLAKLKAIDEVLDGEPLLGEQSLALLRWAADYYHHPIGEVMAAGLPVLLRQGESAQPSLKKHWSLTEAGRAIEPQSIAKRAARQADMLKRLAVAEAGLTEEVFAEAPAGWRQILATMVKKDWVRLEQSSALSLPQPSIDELPILNSEQAAAVKAIGEVDHFQPFLLDGVTGSGKTEVYLRAVQKIIEQGKQVLVMVPEITLTPQLVSRFRHRLAATIVVMHSGLNDRERLNAWLHARSGEAQVVIGTRSAVFTPLSNPGLIIIDEEHDASLKQQSGFRYSARDLAIVSAKQFDIPVVLGSATPGFESLLNVHQGRYQHLQLRQRAGTATPPRIRLLDVRNQVMDEMVSAPLINHIKHHLKLGGQVLLFLNRRGYAPTLICHECGWISECGRCDSHMTWHQRSRSLRCHHCGSQRPVPRQCQSCGSTDLRPLGTGTERVDEALKKAFPDIGIARLDRDSTRRKGSLESILDDVNSGDCRILTGTQMLAKGHHFPNVTLVGILDGDQGLFGIDFRAGERMAQLITQVAGRAGRADKAGEVLIQTHHPDHPLLMLLCDKGYHAYAKESMAERQTAALPPYAHMALLRAEANYQQLPDEFLEQAMAAAQAFAVPGVELYGPLPSPMERRAGKYRAQLLIQCDHRGRLHQLLSQWVEGLAKLPTARKVRWNLDVDPIDLM